MYIEYPIIFYIVAELIYSAIERVKDLTFYLLQLSLYFNLFGLSLLLKIYLSNAYYSLVVGVLFIICTLLPRLILPKHPIEAGGLDVQEKKFHLRLGIIDFVWLSIMGACLTALIFLKSSFICDISHHVNKENLGFYTSVLEQGIQGCITIGGVLVAAMAILWAGEIWREKDIAKRLQYKNTVKAAIKMVIALFLIYISMFLWFFMPLYKKLEQFL